MVEPYREMFNKAFPSSVNNINQTNYYTINGANEETAEMFGSKVDEAMSKALYNQHVNATPGATTSVG